MGQCVLCKQIGIASMIRFFSKIVVPVLEAIHGPLPVPENLTTPPGVTIH